MSSFAESPPFSLDEKDVQEAFKGIQNEICAMLIEESGEEYTEDLWDYEKGEGGGITRVWEGGELLEKAGVNFSAIYGASLPSFAAEKFKIPPGTGFHACGVSLVIHPRNPHAPTTHANIRLFKAGDVWWFGGGIDLTPNFISDNDARAFHRVLRDCCEKHDEDYKAHKEEADRYFYLPHRKEMRGIGGIFVDHLNTDCTRNFAFISDIGHSFNSCYRPLLQKYLRVPYTERERTFQLFRRGRYVEFNLVIDRGTKFGLASGGRTESIMMSLPQTAQFHYNFVPENEEERRSMALFQPGRDWASEPMDSE